MLLGASTNRALPGTGCIPTCVKDVVYDPDPSTHCEWCGTWKFSAWHQWRMRNKAQHSINRSRERGHQISQLILIHLQLNHPQTHILDVPSLHCVLDMHYFNPFNVLMCFCDQGMYLSSRTVLHLLQQAIR